MILINCISSILLLFGSVSGLAQTTSPVTDTADAGPVSADSVATEPARFTVRLPRIDARSDIGVDTLPVVFTAERGKIAGFSLKVGIDSHLAHITGAFPGEFLDSCNWDLFTGRDVSVPDSEGYPSSLYKLIGLARTVPDSSADECFHLDGPSVLAYLTVEYAQAALNADTVIPIFFYWEECADNTMSGMQGESIIMSRQVHNYIGEALSPSEDILPTRHGAPRQCIRPGTHNTPRRLIDFHGGSLTFTPAIVDSLVPRGDSAEQ